MLYNVKTPKDYLGSLEDDWRKGTLMQLREIINTKAPDMEEVISYKMLGYGQGEDILFHLNAQKNYVSLYVGNIKKTDPEGILLKGIDTGKGCLRFRKNVSVAESGIDEFIARTISLWKEGRDMNC